MRRVRSVQYLEEPGVYDLMYIVVDSWLAQARAVLEQVSDTASLDAQVLLAHVLGCSRSWVLAHPEAELTKQQILVLKLALERLVSGEPLPYVLGHWEFYGLDFHISSETLIPRPETELLAEVALNWLRENPGRNCVVDIGTGSGCIAVTLAVHQPSVRIIATDVSQDALHIAARNAVRHNVTEQIHFVAADLLSPFHQRFDMVCSNPPYIPGGALQKLKVARWEPRLALDGGPGGLVLVRRLLNQAREALAVGGLLLIEIGTGQGDLALELARKAFPKGESEVLRDLAGHERLLRVQTER